MDYYEIGQRIRKYRKLKGVSQEQLAELTDISVTHMSHIETGNTKLSLPVFVKLAAALEVSADNLLKDSPSGKTASLAELSELLAACTPKQARVIVEIVKTAKTALDKYADKM